MPPQTAVLLATGVIAFAAFAGPTMAQSCDRPISQAQFARDDLNRAATEGDLPSAQDFADRARREFEQLASFASRCGCATAGTKFQEAALTVRHAQDAESRKVLREVISVVKADFEAGLSEMLNCRKR